MIDWDTICPTIQTLIATISGLDISLVTWRDQAQPYNPHAIVKLNITAFRSIGMDHERISDGGERIVAGVRGWTLGIDVESISQEFDKFAPTYVERIRTRFKRRTSQAILSAVGVSLSTDLLATDVPLVDGDRHWSKYITQYAMFSSFEDVDTSDGAGDWIETVEIAGLGEVQTIVLGKQFDAGFDDGFQRTID